MWIYNISGITIGPLYRTSMVRVHYEGVRGKKALSDFLVDFWFLKKHVGYRVYNHVTKNSELKLNIFAKKDDSFNENHSRESKITFTAKNVTSQDEHFLHSYELQLQSSPSQALIFISHFVPFFSVDDWYLNNIYCEMACHVSLRKSLQSPRNTKSLRKLPSSFRSNVNWHTR